MSSDPVTGGAEPGSISFRSATKVYDRDAGYRRWRPALPGVGIQPRQPVFALDDVDLTISPGEAVGLIGPNGAGKSTALKLLAGVVSLTSGQARLGGRVGSMIELGLGFHPELTGLENLKVSAAMLDVSVAELESELDDIVAFAQLEDKVDEPVKQYSTGMRARLGFALATHIPADVLLVDEVLAVGDREFQERCIDRIHALHEDGTTLVYVSHEMWAIDSVCERVIRLDRGRVVDDGPALEVIRDYLVPSATGNDSEAVGTGGGRIISLEADPTHLAPLGSVTLRADVVIDDPIDDLRIETDLVLATIAPDQPISRHRIPAPDELNRPGHFTLIGRSDPVPTDSGHLAATVRLVDARARSTVAESRTEFIVEHETAGRRPQLATNISFRLESAEAPAMGRPLDQVRRTDGPVVARMEGVTKRFRAGLRRTAARMAIPGPLGEERQAMLTAVDEVDLVVAGACATGLIGPNGAGKTTILRLLAGTMAPTRGRIHVRGRVVSMLDLGLGFHPDMTGLENIRTATTLLGIDSGDAQERLEKITEFAGIGSAVEAPVRQYSTGMKARLGLAVAVNADPDLLLIDEVLAVGDEDFRNRAINAVEARREAGAGVLFVSHDLRLIEEVCDRVVRLEHGRVVDDGPAADVVDRAGGPGWSGGTTQATAGVRLHELRVNRRRLPTGAVLRVSGWLEVADPGPTVRLELGYRAHIDPDDSTVTAEDVAANTMVNRVVEPAGGLLCTPGWYRLHAVIEGNAFVGEVDVLVAAVDSDDGVTVAESWQGVTFGHPGPTSEGMTPVTLPVGVHWHVG